MVRKPIIEDPLTEEQAEQIWKERVAEAEQAVKAARKFIKQQKLNDKDVLFLGALIQLLDGILYKKGGK